MPVLHRKEEPDAAHLLSVRDPAGQQLIFNITHVKRSPFHRGCPLPRPGAEGEHLEGSALDIPAPLLHTCVTRARCPPAQHLSVCTCQVGMITVPASQGW